MAMPLMTPAEFKKIRWDLLLFFAALGIGTAAVVFLHQYGQNAERDLQRAQAERLDVRNKLARVKDEEKEIREKIAKYQSMATQGLIGPEHRLDWVEKVRQFKQGRKLVELQYELSPQHLLDKAIVASDGAGFDVMASPMKPEVQMLHEEDLLNFLADVRQGAQAYVRPRQCSIERLPIATREASNAALLKAECQLDWITFREKK